MTIFVSFVFPEDTETRGAKNESSVLRGTLVGPGLDDFADEVNLRFILFADFGLSGLAGGIAGA